MKCSNHIFCAILTPLFIIAVLASVILFYLLYIYEEESCNYNFIDRSQGFDGEALFLTPYIKRGEIRKGQKLALVKNWKGVDSYSGFLTVNPIYNSNLFFWFFPYVKDSLGNVRPKHEKPAPVILYLQGGPGISSMFGLFLETGPFKIDAELNFDLRHSAWTKTHSMLYIDSPVGTGFSFTDKTEGFAKEQKDVSRDLYEALIQFFTLFPEYRTADFYIAGTSYAGKYIPILAYKIHVENQIGPLVLINLRGIAIGSGYFDSVLQNEFSDFYYNLGLLDGKQKAVYQIEEQRIRELVEAKMFPEARDAIANLFQTTRENYTGFNDILIQNAMEPHTPVELTSFELFLNKKCIRSALHVYTGRINNYSLLSFDAYSHFHASDFFHSPKAELEGLLRADYKVLMYAAQLDTIIVHTSVAKFLRSLEWAGAHTYRTIEREIWRVNGGIAGYVKQTGNFAHVLIRNSGHIACYEQPHWCFDMITRFTNGSSFRDEPTIRDFFLEESI